MPRMLYLSGPMTGLPEWNFPAFDKAAQRWREAGWDVVNPAEVFGGQTDLKRSVYMKEDIKWLLRCDAIAFLPGWQKSKGASLEFLIAGELDLEMFDAETMTHLRVKDSAPSEPVLRDAEKWIAVTWEHVCGHPVDYCTAVAKLWTTLLARKLQPNKPIAAGDVPLCIIAARLAQQSHGHRHSNLVDIAGYAQIAQEVAEAGQNHHHVGGAN